MLNPHPDPNLPQRDCDRLRALLPAYAIGATDPDETALVERLLGQCPEVADELAEYAGLAQALSFTMPITAPPAGLHDRLLAKARQTPQQQADMPGSVPAEAIMPTTPAAANLTPTMVNPNAQMLPPAPRPDAAQAAVRRLRRGLVVMGTAAAALLIATNVYWLLQVNDLRRQQQENSDRLEALTLAAAYPQRVMLAAPNGMPNGIEEALVSVAWDEQDAVLVALALPPLPPQREYQVWLIEAEGGTPVSAGTFSLDTASQGRLRFTLPRPISAYAAIAISAEPAGGSPQPTTDPLVVGEV